MDLKKLGTYFAPEELEWKPITVSKKTGKALAAAYVTNRAIMNRLDEVCEPENWWNEFREGPCGGLLCGLTIRTDAGPVTKWDGAENTDIEAIKGGLSSSMRRAAVQWNIGRYLYDFPQQWVDVDERGRFTREPRVPAEFLPPHSKFRLWAEGHGFDIADAEVAAMRLYGRSSLSPLSEAELQKIAVELKAA